MEQVEKCWTRENYFIKEVIEILTTATAKESAYIAVRS